MKYLQTILLNGLFLFLFVIIGQSLKAQEYIDIVRMSSVTSPSNTFDQTNKKTTLHEFTGDLTLPNQLNETVAFLTGLSYEQFTTSLDIDQRRTNLFGATVKMGLNIQHNQQWSGTYMLLPKIASDLKQLSRQDIQLGGAVLLKYTRSDHFNYKFGVYTNQERFGTFIVPMFGFYYLSPSERFEAKVLLPLSADLNYAITNHLKLGVNFKGQVRSYNINDQNNHSIYLSRSTNELCAYLGYEIKSGLNLEAEIGHSFARSYRLYEETVSLGMPLVYFGDNRQQLNTDFSDGFILKASIFYRFHFDKKK